ncbi:hypothetical protein F7C95_02675 [Opitutia bacterium ISCC 51]|nr:hypothetical protein F7C95_02675 [Opitutae bacterium ISCC 51]QXD28898.1 hypothetical protein GA003_02655 [Opitutae bacterium ISCC 52]
MQNSFRILLILGFLMQVVGRYIGSQETEFIPGFPPFYLMVFGIAIFTLGSIQYARSKGRLWTWGLFGIVLPFFLIVVLIPRRTFDD